MADPDFHTTEGPGHPDPEMRGVPGLQKIVWAFGP